MENLYQSLIILDYFAWVLMRKAEIIYSKSLIKYTREKKIFDDDNYHLLSHSCVLNMCSFLEEYHENFGVKTEPVYNERVRILKKICSPYIKAIKMWPGFNANRNLLAHTLKDKSGQFAYLDPDHEMKYLTPGGGLHWIFIRDCVIGIKNVLNSEFKLELEQAVKELEKLDYRAKVPTVMKGSEVANMFKMVVDQSEKIARDHGKVYDLNIANFYENNKPAVHFGMMDSF